MKRPYLGELNTAYEEYLEVVESAPEGDEFILLRPEVQKDALQKALEKVKPGTPLEDLKAILNLTQYTKLSHRQLALVRSGFAGTIPALFGTIAEITADSRRPIDTQTLDRIAVYRSIPLEHLKGARVVPDDGTATHYYYGGRPVALLEEQDFVD